MTSVGLSPPEHTTDVAYGPQLRPRLGVVLRLTAGIAVLWYLLSRVDLSEVTIDWQGRVVPGLLMVSVLLSVALVLSTVRWSLILGAATVPFAYLCRLYFIGSFFSLFLPTSVGGDAVRALALSRANGRAGGVVSSILLERLLGVAALVAVFTIGVLAAPGLIDLAALHLGGDYQLAGGSLAAVLVILVAILAGGAVVAWRSPRVRRFAADAAELWRRFATAPREILLAVFVSLLVQLTYVFAWQAIAVAMRLPIPFSHLLVLVPFVSLAAMIPITLAGLGIREGAWVLLLQQYGITTGEALAFSLLYLVGLLVVGALGGLSFAVRGLAPSSSTTSRRVAESVSQL